MTSRPEILLPPDSNALAWRYDMKMGNSAGSCAGLVYDLHTPALIERRVKEMADEGLNTIIINGLHMHHCFLHRWPRVTKFVSCRPTTKGSIPSDSKRWRTGICEWLSTGRT